MPRTRRQMDNSCHMTADKRFPGFTVNAYIWSVFALFRFLWNVFSTASLTWPFLFQTSCCVGDRLMSDFRQLLRVRDLLILHEIWCTYCNSEHFLFLFTFNYMALLSTVFLLNDFWPRCFCFVSPHTTLWFPICVVTIKHNITACDYFHSFLKK